MANSYNGGDNESYNGNSSLLGTAGPTIPPIDPLSGAAKAPILDPVLGTNTPTPAPTLDSIVGPVTMNPLFYEQLSQLIMKTINSTLHDSQASGALERGGTQGSHGIDEHIPTSLQQN